MPGSASNGYITMTGVLQLEQAQAAYYVVDRNAAFSVVGINNLTVADISDIPINENVFIFAYRLNT